jgi:hypothetical protein
MPLSPYYFYAVVTAGREVAFLELARANMPGHRTFPSDQRAAISVLHKIADNE